MLKSISQLSFILNVLALFFAMVFSLIRKNKELRPVQYYLLSTIVFIFLVFIPDHTPSGRLGYNMIFNVSGIIDITTLYYYFYTLLARRSLRRWLIICFFVFIGLALFFWLGPAHAFTKFWGTLYGIENIFITIPCFFYFYQVFNSEAITDFKTNPHFFVVCGVLFFYATTFPFYISYKIMYDVTPDLYKSLIIVSNILSMILYSTIIKAYLCPRPALR